MNTYLEFEYKKFFTSDALDLINNYLLSLKNLMNQAHISSEQINVVVTGIFEFISEYATNFEQNKIDFSSTLKLIDEIGSPTEIIQSLDSKQSLVDSSIICPHCKLTTSTTGKFCEHCGKYLILPLLTTNQQEKLDIEDSISKHFKKTRKQDLIDHPFSRSFILFTALSFSSLVIGVIFSYTYYIFFNVSNSFFLLLIVVGIPFFSIFPCLFLSLIFYVSVNFFLKGKKTAKDQFDEIFNDYEQNFFIGFLWVYFGSVILSFTTIAYWWLNLSIFFWVSLVIILFDFIFVIYYGIPSIQYDIHFSLLNTTIGKINQKKVIKNNLAIILPTFVLGFITEIPSYYININFFIIFGLVFSISYLSIFNGFLRMKLNSWKTISTYV